MSPYFRSSPAFGFTSFVNGTLAVRSVVSDETAYGLSSRFIDWAGVSTPTSVPATAICVIPFVPYEAGTPVRNDTSFFHFTMRLTLMPQVFGPRRGTAAT